MAEPNYKEQNTSYIYCLVYRIPACEIELAINRT